MLQQLRVANFALIEDLTLSLTPGLNILSGETGAGKSIIIGAINLLLGERSSAEQVRSGCDTALVEGIFVLPEPLADLTALLEEGGLQVDEELIIAREVTRGGRSIGRVQGRAVPITFLKEVGRLLVDLHGQHQHQSLLRPEQHLELLDSFGGNKLEQSRETTAHLYRQRQQMQQELASLGSSAAERERHMDVLDFQLKEIAAASLTTGEEEELAKQERLLANAEKIIAAVSRAYAEIYGGDDAGSSSAVDCLNSSRSVLSEASLIDESLSPLLEMLESAAAQLDEVSIELRDYRSRLDFNPGELTSVQERLNQIRALKRKYGGTVEEVLNFASEAERELERLKNSEALAVELEGQIRQIEEQLQAESSQLRSLRREVAANLEQRVEENLRELALPGASFKVSIEEKDHFTVKGMDQIEFLFSANRGEGEKPLAKIISGGEMSRVMLALKAILARQDSIPTLIFDEVDAGIGGVTIQSVAEKLALIGANHQVLCVTHSPQIAAMADNHILLYKEQKEERTYTRAETLHNEKRREELARMLDGASIDEVSLNHVDSLLDRSYKFKKKESEFRSQEPKRQEPEFRSQEPKRQESEFRSQDSE